jgi:hypothetical protein
MQIRNRFPWLHIFRKPEGEGDAGGGGGDAGAGGGDAGGAGGDKGTAGGDAGGKPAAAAGGDGKPVSLDWGAWANGLTDEAKRNYAKTFKDPDALLDGALNLRREISSRIKVPGKDAKPEEVAAFRKAIGALDKPEDYKAALPKDYQLDEVQTALLASMQKAAADTGLPAPSFEQFTKAYFEFESQVQAKIGEELDAYMAESEAALKAEFGADYDKKARAAKLFIDAKLNVPEFARLLDETVTWNGRKIQLGSHPAVVKAMALIGERTAEDGVIGYRSESETADLDRRIRALEQKYPIGQRTNQQDREIRTLYEQRYG